MPYCDKCKVLYIPPAKCDCPSESSVAKPLTLDQMLLVVVHGLATPDMAVLRGLRDLSLPRVLELGHPMGRGGTNCVYELTAQPMVLCKNAGASSGKSREYSALVKMEEVGLTTVRRDLATIDEMQMILMHRVLNGIDSKSIVGYQRTLTDYISLECGTPSPQALWKDYLLGHTVGELIVSFQLMATSGHNFSDYQFMIDGDGSVVHNDPVDVVPFKGSGGTTKVVIQACIDTWEYLNHPLGKAMSWLEFKRLKYALARERLATFGKALQDQRISVPALCILDYRAFDWSDVLCECVFFRGRTRVGIPNWRVASLPSGEFWYTPLEDLPAVRCLFGSRHYDGAMSDVLQVDAFLKHHHLR